MSQLWGVELMGCRTSGVSDLWGVAIEGCRTCGVSERQSNDVKMNTVQRLAPITWRHYFLFMTSFLFAGHVFLKDILNSWHVFFRLEDIFDS